MKKTIILITIVCCSLLTTFSFGQNSLNIVNINEIADKEQATFEDCVWFFMLLTEKKPGLFQENISKLNDEGITKGVTVAKDAPLRRGTLALMTARYLKLRDSFLYNIFRTERYAYRACIAHDLMNYDGSEWDRLSGGELVEIMRKVSDFSGGKSDAE